MNFVPIKGQTCFAKFWNSSIKTYEAVELKGNSQALRIITGVKRWSITGNSGDDWRRRV
ncbi:hypothetical protein HanRHA438_Chr08g0355901 [Helianthus annuus]|nr:hypothetical protein HanRHA438_Chr08g0355901 [Helianthus annuus]